MYIADLHIHSRFSRATSKDGDAPHLDWWARRKGIGLVGTGDFTHPAWRRELREHLVPAGDGVYALREDLILPGAMPGQDPRFVVTGEISCIYKRGGRTRKVHNLILLPSLEAADELSARLEAIGNIRSDGRPILGLDSRDLLELTLECCPEAELIPAHIWTPHFAMLGAFSGFDGVEECFADLADHIHAVETGLSSDPPMNWRLSGLDRFTLVSHSDAHSPSKLGREADLLDAPLSYPGLVRAIRTGEGFLGTVEFFPEEGKYHLDGHRSCGVCLTPAETQERDGRCPVCGKKLTIGVEHRVEALADRPAGFRPQRAKPFESLAPLPEVIAASTGASASSKGTLALYEDMLSRLGPEFYILREAPTADIQRVAGPCVAEGIRRLRAGEVERRAGFDGEYGVISLLSPGEIGRLSGQISLFEPQAPARRSAKKGLLRAAAAKKGETAGPAERNPEQEAAVTAPETVVSVAAGPGTGKTKTLADRVAWLIREKGVLPGEITAVTFTNQAAGELRSRLEARLGGKRAASRLHIGTFHALCLELLGDVRLLDQGEALTLAAELLTAQGSRTGPRALLQGISRVKNGVPPGEAGVDEALFQAYGQRLEELGALDFDDLLLRALEVDVTGRRSFLHLLVDEFQDVSEVQYELVRAWSGRGRSLFVIGDPDQSVYGFRGASPRCFQRLREDCPDLGEYRLRRNYRSAPPVLAAALPVIEKNPGGPRELLPQRSGGSAVRLAEGEDEFAEAVFISKEIGRMAGGVDMLEAQKLGAEREARSFSDIAVLCRTRRQLELIEKCLRHDDIPCIISGREDFWEAEEVRALMAFLRSLTAPEDSGALAVLETLGLSELWRERAEEWRPLAEREKPWRLVEQWEERYGATPALDKLRHAAVFHPTFAQWWESGALGQEADFRRASGRGWEAGAVALMTLHAAKGLEFPAVFLAGVREGVLPLERPDADREEERRLLYVGMTRARDELIVTYSGQPSPFLADLPARRERIRGWRPGGVQMKLF